MFVITNSERSLLLCWHYNIEENGFPGTNSVSNILCIKGLSISWSLKPTSYNLLTFLSPEGHPIKHCIYHHVINYKSGTEGVLLCRPRKIFFWISHDGFPVVMWPKSPITFHTGSFVINSKACYLYERYHQRAAFEPSSFFSSV